ncbi:hypothetical protein GM661_02535 [Iocasia frigidifontis]|uniref:Uncharacterized protein n=1 Tax=Iocasia fonsfrigidae TaxID=2682810 RepID=A0A8A7K6Y6_9FIRM|nr:DUF6470 family protein [Iocasia fonsfrigidae]QTL96930.1 hypothetical protein GM661_02535 [Iocasia fonsfrigidae]
MNIPQLKINFTRAQIGMKWIRGSMEIEQNIPQLDIDYGNSRPYQVVGDMEISNPPAEMEIDYTKPLEDLGYRKLYSLINFMSNKAKEKALEGIKEDSRDGDYLGKLELGGNRIAQLARSKLLEEKQEVNVELLPKHPPDIKVKTYPVKVTVDPADIDVESNFAFPKAKIRPDRVKIYLAQKAKLDIELVEHQVNIKV